MGVMYQMRPDGEKPGPLYKPRSHTQAAFARSTMLNLNLVTSSPYVFLLSRRSRYFEHALVSCRGMRLPRSYRRAADRGSKPRKRGPAGAKGREEAADPQ